MKTGKSKKKTLLKKNESMAALILEWREFNHLSQFELAKKLGYTTAQFISNLENGKCGFPKNKFIKLSRILGLDINTIVTADVADYAESLRDQFLK